MAGVPGKISAFLRKAGFFDDTSFVIPSGDGVSIDATNFYEYSQGNPNIVFDNQVAGFLGRGYMRVGSTSILADEAFPSISFPISVETVGKIKVYVRARLAAGTFLFGVSINDVEVKDVTLVNGSPNTWSWFEVEVVIPDKTVHKLTIKPKCSDVLIDALHITQSTIPITVTIDESPFVTVHAKVYEVDGNGQPTTELAVYDAKNTLSDILIDDWYNFSVATLTGNTTETFDQMCSFVLFASGTSSNRYVIWDLASNVDSSDPYATICALTFDDMLSSWSPSCTERFAIKVYSFLDSLDPVGDTLSTPESTLTTKDVQQFDESGMDTTFFNTKIVEVSASANEVELDLPDRLVTGVIDQSGSMTWNDNEGDRHDLFRRMLTRLNSSYPGDVRYNLLSFGGTPIRVNFFGVVESPSINTDDTSAVASQYFADQESGYAGVRVVRKKGSYPTTPVDGEVVVEGFIDRAYDDNLDEGDEYFYKIFTFNSQGTFSDGVEISAIPRTRTIPRGVATFSANILKGTGVRLDDDVIAVWHMTEKSGRMLYDFTSNKLHAGYNKNEDAVWLNANDVPVGTSGIRLDQPNWGSLLDSYFVGNDPDEILNLDQPFTFMAWVQYFGDVYSPLFVHGDESFTDWDVVVQTGNVQFLGTSSVATLEVGEWNHVAITYNPTTNDVYYFINGVKEGPYTGAYFATPVTKFVIGASFLALYSFRGKVCELSCHKTIRSDEYIIEASTIPVVSADKALDNGDRLVVLNYSIPDNYDYSGGNVRIVRREETGEAVYSFPGTLDENGKPKKVFEGFGLPPYHENDGDVVYEGSPSSGTFSLSFSDSYVHGRKYDFRMFTQNSLGNYSVISDSPLLKISIPELGKTDRDNWIGPPSSALPNVQNVETQAGNRKVYISWSPASLDDRIRQVKVYYKETGYPVVTTDGVEAAATLVFDGNPNQTDFVHRNIENDKTAYYAIVTADQFGYISSALFISEVPKVDANEVGIPLLEVLKLQYRVVSEEALSLAWEQPVRFQKDIDCWFDDRVVVYAQLTDEFGAPIQDLTHIDIQAVNASSDNAGLAEDVFGETIDRTTANPDARSLFALSTTQIGDGFVRGLLRTSADILTLSASNKLSIELRIVVKIPSRDSTGANAGVNAFEFYSLPIQVSMKNPWSMSVVNYSGDAVEHLCKQEVPLFDPEFLSGGGGFEPNKFKTFDGCYVRKTDPVVARVIMKYRDRALPGSNNVYVAIHEASDPQCDSEDPESPPFEPGFSDHKSRTVVPPATTMTTRNAVVEIPGGTEEITFCDIPFNAPRTPQAVMLFVKGSYNSFISRRKMYFVFENILRVELNVQDPRPDCIDVAEQFCTAYLIDPDNPTSRTQIPDFQIIRWTLQKGISGKNRPFYSLDSVPAGPGIFSYLRNGTARKIFFGPACGVVWTMYNLGPERGGITFLPEMYAVKASLTYDQLQAFEELPITIYPLNTNSYFGSRFLMELPTFINDLYADGYEYKTLKIARNPNSTPGFAFGECFRDCANSMGGTLFMMNYGQIVEITTGDDFDIMWGDDIEITTNEEINEPEFSGGSSDIATANVNLSSSEDTTSVYLRINKFVGPPPPESGGSGNEEPGNGEQRNECSCLEIPEGLKAKETDLTIFGRTTLIISGESRYLSGGGSLERGIPPTLIRLKEPLDIRIVDIRRNGVPVEQVLVDGVSEHTVYVEVSFKQRPVPDGTPVLLTIGGTNPESMTIAESTIYTVKQNDLYINPTGEEKSLTSFRILPFAPNASFSADVTAECRYDKKGTVSRSMTACLTVTYDASQQQEDPQEGDHGAINNVFSGRLERYDTLSDTWVELESLEHPRGGLTLTWAYDAYGEFAFAIGGINGKAITAYNERYNIAEDVWEEAEPMPVGRFYHMAVEESGVIYVMGGIGLVGADLQVLRNLYMYDPYSDEWTELEPMPAVGNITYGVAMGTAVVVDGKIYVLGGINAVGAQGAIESLNDRVLIYDIDSDTWSTSDSFVDLELELYRRIAPFAFVSGTSIMVTGGATVTGEQQPGEPQELEYITDTYAYDTLAGTLERNDESYMQMPQPRYKGQCSSIGTDHYFFGGGNKTAKVSKRLEKIGTSVSPWSYTRLADIDQGMNGFGMSNDGIQYLYVAGGITSGRPAGFLQINAKTSKQKVLLDGKESVGLDIELRNDVGERPSIPVRVNIRGYLVFPGNQDSGDGSGGDENQQSATARENLVYPVVFSRNDFYITNGLGSTLMLPRSDDILRKMDEIKARLGIEEQLTGAGQQSDTLVINEGEERLPYQIRVQITVLDDFYYGQTVVDIKDNEDPQPQSGSGSGSSGEPGSGSSGGSGGPTAGGGTSGENCRSITGTSVVGGSGGGPTGGGSGTPINEGLSEASNNSIFDLTPNQTDQNPSPLVQYYCNIDWIPQVVRIIDSNDGSYAETLQAINRLANSIPFGGSPLFDGLSYAAEILLDESAQSYSKVIYANTDNEENLSFASGAEVIEEIQAIDGFNRTPVIMNNFSIVFPITLSALLARTDTDSLDTIATETGGQSQTILDAAYLNDVLNNSIGRLAGSIGWGQYEGTVDLGIDCVINGATLDFTLYPNTDGSWQISVSSDGYNFSEFSDKYDADANVTFTNLQGRYIRFRVELLSGLTASIEEAYDTTPTPGIPALTGIHITYSLPKESLIFVNPETCDFSAQQIIASVNATRPFLSTIDVGAATSLSHNWADYATGSQPSVDQRGKIFIPVRTQQDDSSLNEPLESIDGFAWKAKYGSWSFDSRVIVRDDTGEALDESSYRVYPRNGLVVFSTKQNGPFSIDIENSATLRLGIRIINRFAGNAVSLFGFGFLYNTNIFLPPPLSQRPPEATNVTVVPGTPNIYSKIEVSYRYFDINRDIEDTEKTEIRWYINGVEREYLRGLTTWNDISNDSDPIWVYGFTFSRGDVPQGQSVEEYARSRGESILRVGDVVYVSVKPSDGSNFGKDIRSPSVVVVEAPPFVTSLSIKGRRSNGTVEDNVTTATTAFAEYNYFSDGTTNESTIRWYVNGIQFKEGPLAGTTGGLPNNEIQTGENSLGIVPLTIGNELEVEIIPAAGNTVGNPFRSDVVTVQNDPPVVRNAVLSPPNPTSASNLQLTYQFFDNEISQGATNQSNQSSIRWWKAARGSDTFVEVPSLANQTVVSNINTASGEKWKAQIIPFDGVSVGDSVDSNIVTIQ